MRHWYKCDVLGAALAAAAARRDRGHERLRPWLEAKLERTVERPRPRQCLAHRELDYSFLWAASIDIWRLIPQATEGSVPLLQCIVLRFWSTSPLRCWSWQVMHPRISKLSGSLHATCSLQSVVMKSWILLSKLPWLGVEWSLTSTSLWLERRDIRKLLRELF